MKKIYKVGNEDIEIGAHAPKITGFHPDTGAPVFEGQIIEEKEDEKYNFSNFEPSPNQSIFPHRSIIDKNSDYIYATPLDRIQVVLINILILFAIYSLVILCYTFFEKGFVAKDLFSIICLIYLCFIYRFNLGMIIKKMYIVNENIEKASFYPKLTWPKKSVLPGLDYRKRLIIKTDNARVIAIFLLFLIFPLFIISVICLFKTNKHQMIHDILLNEYVVKKVK